MPLFDRLNRRRGRQSEPASAADLEQRAQTLVAQGVDEFNRGSPACEALLLQAARDFQKLARDDQLVRVALALGRAYLHIRGLRDLDKAAKWYEVAAEKARGTSRFGQALGSLATLELQTFEEKVQGGIPAASLRGHLDMAERLLRQALQTFNAGDHVMRGVTEGTLARVLALKGEVQEAEEHQRRAIREHTVGGDAERAASATLNWSSLMIQAGRLDEALSSVADALEGFEDIPPDQRSVDWQQKVDILRKRYASIRKSLGRKR